MTQSRIGLTLSAALWAAITLYGGYFLYNLIHPSKEGGPINFGIDLVGGTYLTLEVKVEEAVKNDLMSIMQGFIDDLKQAGKPTSGAPKVEDSRGRLVFGSAAEAIAAKELYKPDPSLPKVIQEGNELSFVFSESQFSEIQKEAIESNIAILRNRLDAFGAGEVGIVPQGSRRIGIELPNVTDPEKAKERIGKAAVLELKPVFDVAISEEELIDRAGGSLPEGTMIVPHMKNKREFYLVPDFAKITGKLLRQASYDFHAAGQGSPHTVKIEFKPEGAKKFADLTSEYVKKHVAIILDNAVVTAPRVESPIETGTAWISGTFEQEEAEEVVALLKSGAFSAPVEVIEERHIGPSLGAESIHKGLMSCAIAFGLVFLFSLIVYKVAGIFAFIVLIYNLLFILFGLALIPDATLTLPGIAGMVLTIGMAIDSSILIYERIKELLAQGFPLSKAIDEGFSGATAVILDANITTFIVGAVLYYFGSPAIQGFALTMMIGIAATLLTGLILLKTIFNWVLAAGVTRIQF